MTRLASICLLFVFLAPFGPVSAFETAAQNAIVMDYRSGRVLFAKDIDTPIPTASMSKLVTVYMLLEEMAKGRFSEDDLFPISEKAWRKGGSKMFVEVGKEVRVGDLLRGIIVQSGNDASIVVAEAMAGSEEAFAEQATRRMRELGLTATTLKNATGWPDPDHRMSVHDLARVARLMIRNFPEHYSIYSEKSFTFNNIKQGNRNPVLYRFNGADGLKTGHTNEAGYGLVASAIRDGQRLITVISGLESSRQRASEGVKLLDWAFRTYRNYRLVEAGELVDRAQVWMGEQKTVPLVLKDDLALTMDAETRKGMKVHLVYDGPIPAPIRSGQKLADLVVRIPGSDPIRTPVFAGEDVAKLGVGGRILEMVGHLIFDGM